MEMSNVNMSVNTTIEKWENKIRALNQCPVLKYISALIITCDITMWKNFIEKNLKSRLTQ